MDLRILDTNLNPVALVDNYESFIWTERYYEYGDFELYTAMTVDAINYIKRDYYVQSKDSDRLMIIEKITIDSDAENGDHVTITGRSLESILDRRIIWGLKTISGNLQNAIKTLLNECIISPSIASRKISNFIFEASTDPVITALTVDAQYTGDNLYDVIQKLCKAYDIGFKIVLNNKNQFVFSLYSGVDRSYDQTKVPYVIFSPKFDNIINSNYVEDKSELKTVTLIGGEGEGIDRRYYAIAINGASGLNRREIFTDARDISSQLENDEVMTEAEYNELLKQRGVEKLSEYVDIIAFEGQVETTRMFVYGVDFFNGDIVQLANEYGQDAKARILEIVTSEDADGLLVYPTFKALEYEGDATS